MIKIDVFSGFLGAGKTTLIKRMIKAYANEKVVLIENEFGEIGIDGAFLNDEVGIEIKEINSGCICCTLTGDFSKALHEVIEEYNPDRIIIEPSGVGKLSDIKKIINHAGLEINMLVTVVDAGKGKLYMRNFGEFFNDQIGEARTILISKVDRNPQCKVQELTELIREKNPTATIITTPVGELAITKLISIFENCSQMLTDFMNETNEEHHHECHCHEDEECHCKENNCECLEEDGECHCHDEGHECHCHDDEEHHECHCHEDEECHCKENNCECLEEDGECHCHDEGHECHCHEHHHDDEECHCHEHHHADEVFNTWGMETPFAFSKSFIENFLKQISSDDRYGVIIRAKGILKASDNTEWYYFDLVDDEYEIRLGKPDYTGRLCVIGADIDKEKIKNSFLKRD